MSRTHLVTERILTALNPDPRYHQHLLASTTAPSSFGLVQVAVFIMLVGDNELNAEMVERRILTDMEANNIYVAFHKTRRVEGERLITVTKPLEPEHRNFTYGNLKAFTKLWLIEATGANHPLRARHPTPSGAAVPRMRHEGLRIHR